MTKIEAAVQWAEKMAADNSHGYSQADRWGPDYDCSSFVIAAWEAAGVRVKSAGASYTGNMRGAFLAMGFVDVTYECGLSTGYGIQRGDVLLNYSAHTCLAAGNGKVINCRTDEGNPQAGDQSGNEIRVQSYWNYPWDCVLRYKKDDNATGSTGSVSGSAPAEDDGTLHYGAKGEAVKAMQQKLIDLGYSCGSCGADGVYGYDTISAVRKFQKDHGLPVSAGANKKTQEAIQAAKKEAPAIATEPEKEEQSAPVSAPVEEHDWNPEPLKNGVKYSRAIVVLQALLNVRGFNCGNPDGYYGVMTEAAVNHAKRYYGMPQDGECSTELWDKLLGR